MATVYTDEYTAIIGGASQTYTPLKPNQLEGRVRVAWFTKEVTASAPVSNGDVIYATKLPKGARVLLGQVSHDAMGTSTTMSVGCVGSATKYKAATAVASAGSFFFAQGADEHGLEVSTDNDQIIMLTAGGANYTAARTIKGFILYVID